MSTATPETAHTDEQPFLQDALSKGIVDFDAEGILTAKVKDEVVFVLVGKRLSGEKVGNEYGSLEIVHVDDKSEFIVLRSPNYRQNDKGEVFHVSKLRKYNTKKAAA